MRGRGRGEGRLAKASRPALREPRGPPLPAPRRPRWRGEGAAWPGAAASGSAAGGRLGQRRCRRGGPGRRAGSVPAALRGPARRPPAWGAGSPGGWVTLPQEGPGGVRPHCASAERAFLGSFCALPLAASGFSSGVNFIKTFWRRWFDLFCIFI